MRHNETSCKVCTSSAEVRDAINREIILRHGYRRIALRWNLSKSLLHVHGVWFLSERLRERRLNETCPNPCRFYVSWPDGRQSEVFAPYDPFKRLEIHTLPLVELAVEFEEAIPPRAPQTTVTPDIASEQPEPCPQN